MENENYKLRYAQEAIKSIELETALNDAIAMLVPDLVSSQDRDFKDVCRDVKQSLLRNARKTMKVVLEELIKDQKEVENDR